MNEIKKNYRIMSILVGIVSIPTMVLGSTMGTCSWHGGVNCMSGADWDGSAICNDGWRDSSEKFYSQQACIERLYYCSDNTRKKLWKKYKIDSLNQKMSSVADKTLNLDDGQLDYREVTIKSLQNMAESSSVRNDIDVALLQFQNECHSIGRIEYIERIAKENAEQQKEIQDQVEEVRYMESVRKMLDAVTVIEIAKIDNSKFQKIRMRQIYKDIVRRISNNILCEDFIDKVNSPEDMEMCNSYMMTLGDVEWTEIDRPKTKQVTMQAKPVVSKDKVTTLAKNIKSSQIKNKYIKKELQVIQNPGTKKEITQNNNIPTKVGIQEKEQILSIIRKEEGNMKNEAGNINPVKKLAIKIINWFSGLFTD